MGFTSSIFTLIVGSAITGSAVPGRGQLAKPSLRNITDLGFRDNVRGLGTLICRHLDSWTVGAEPLAIIDGINHLHRKKGQPCGVKAGPGACTRLSCFYNSGIYLCNDLDKEINVDCSTIGDTAQLILDQCTWRDEEEGYQWVEGQAFDSDNWNVMVVSSNGRDGQC